MEEPMYIKIHNQIKRDIENHVYQVGDRIPAERQLAVKFGVSRMTLRQAIKTLEDEGILERRLGSGTYVASQKVQEKKCQELCPLLRLLRLMVKFLQVS